MASSEPLPGASDVKRDETEKHFARIKVLCTARDIADEKESTYGQDQYDLEQLLCCRLRNLRKFFVRQL